MVQEGGGGVEVYVTTSQSALAAQGMGDVSVLAF